MSLPIRVVERYGYMAHGDGQKAQTAAVRRLNALRADGYVGDLTRFYDGDLGDCWIVRAFLREALRSHGESVVLNMKQMRRQAGRRARAGLPGSLLRLHAGDGQKAYEADGR